MDLTDEQWAILSPLIPELPRRPDGRGRSWKSARNVLNGLLWILRTGAPWKDMPQRYPPYQTCHRRFQRWEQEGVMDRVLLSLAQDLKERGDLDVRECFRRHLRGRQKRGAGVGKTKRGKGTKVMAVADRAGLSIAICVTRAGSHEVTLVAETLEKRFLAEQPEKLIGDRACDSDPLDEQLAAAGIEMIAPHRRNRTKRKTQDGRKLRRFRRRWKVRRLFAWLGNYRRLVVRYEHKLEN